MGRVVNSTVMNTTLPPAGTPLAYLLRIVTKEVENKISTIFPDRYSLIIDGWTNASTHYFRVFASFSPNQSYSGKVLLGFSPLLSESSLSASEYYEFLKYVLELYEKSLDNVVCLVCDNCEVNKALLSSRRV